MELTKRNIQLQEKVNAAGKGKILFFLCFGVFMVYLDSTIVNIALPYMQADLKMSMSGLQWIIDAYALSFACLLLTSGSIGDVWGHRNVFLFGITGFTLASVLCGLSQSYESLLVGRTLQGIFGSLMTPVSLAIIRGLYDDSASRARAIGIWAGLGGLALAMGPLVGGVLVEHFSWQSIFWINIPIGLVVVTVLARILPRAAHREGQSREIDWLGQLLFAAGIAAMAYGLIEGGSHGWSSVSIVGCFIGSALILVLFAIRLLKVKNPLLPLSLLRNRIFLVVCAVNFFGFFGLYTVIFLFTLYLQRINGLSAGEAGVRFLALTLSIMLASIIGSSLSQRIKPKTLILTGILILTASLFALTSLQTDSSYSGYWWMLTMLGVGVSLVGSAATIALMTSVSPAMAGTASGIMNTSRQISAVFGIAVSGALITGNVNSGLINALSGMSLNPNAQNRLAEGLSTGNLNIIQTFELAADSRAKLLSAAANLFVEGMHTTFIYGGIAGITAGIAALLLLPRERNKRF
jgi:EmrB/QacA subfamily drug resistance transporter